MIRRPRNAGPAHSGAAAFGSSIAALALLGLAMLAIGFATLRPAPGEASPPPLFCLRCGSTGLADALRNVVLFVPLGAGVILARGRTGLAIALGFALSFAIECVQAAIPGRDPSARDLIANGLGAAAGAFAVTAALRSRGRPRPAFALAIASAALAVVALASALQSRSFPRAAWYGGHTIDLGNFEHYRGHIVSAAIGEQPLGEGRLPEADARALREALDANRSWHVELVSGPTPRQLAPLLSIHDANEREIVLLAARGDALLVRERARGADLLLEAVDTRFDGALRDVPPGQSLSIDLRTRGSRRCLAVQRREQCVVSRRPGRGWALVASATKLSESMRGGLDAIWLALLALPIGFCLRAVPSGTVATVLWTGGLFAIPGAAQPGVTELAGALGGLALGQGLARVARRSGPTRNGVDRRESR